MVTRIRLHNMGFPVVILEAGQPETQMVDLGQVVHMFQIRNRDFRRREDSTKCLHLGWLKDRGSEPTHLHRRFSCIDLTELQRMLSEEHCGCGQLPPMIALWETQPRFYLNNIMRACLQSRNNTMALCIILEPVDHRDRIRYHLSFWRARCSLCFEELDVLIIVAVAQTAVSLHCFHLRKQFSCVFFFNIQEIHLSWLASGVRICRVNFNKILPYIGDDHQQWSYQQQRGEGWGREVQSVCHDC
mmetsp:Transcript_44468/g.79698  ORF Transcript_44468/g.79698 Transcript_44468/m.79698 type:complete len:244 (+) Transcript_44468:4443-5174(+)